MNESLPLEDFLSSAEEKGFSWDQSGARVDFIPKWLNPDAASRLMEELISKLDWTQPKVRIYGKEHPVPRQVAWVGTASYTYSGLIHQPKPWPSCLKPIRARLEAECKTPFNGCLLNLYRNGNDSMGWHSDDEPELGKNPTIASLSLGTPRRFRFRTKKDQDEIPPPETTLGHGDLIIMSGTTQEIFQHEVPKERGISEMRVNLTYRDIRH